MRFGFAVPLLWMLALALLMPVTAKAASLEELVMPGPVIQGHAKLESDCGQCHTPFSKTSQSTLCLACHKETNADVTGQQGFHGRIKNIATTECKQCHTEHKGRDADIVLLDKETFNHRATDFQIGGAHARVVCASCHVAGKKFRQAPSECVACHKADDRHKGTLGKDCASCHTDKGWREARFDHDRATKFPLVGRHREVLCASCHTNEQYKKTPTDCFSCHRLNDVHGGRFGQKCEQCHSTTDWRRTKFDHNKQTKFPLLGAHARTTCRGCHSEKIFGDKLDTACISCHRNDDEHHGRNGPTCENCHSVETWGKSSFNHAKTKFPLRGKHAKLACETCHKGTVGTEKLGITCDACHQRDDVHKGQLGQKCDNCHNVNGWGEKVFFDHDLTRFPLIGLHAVVPCEECHISPTYKGTTLDCVGCHEKRDVHKRQLGTKCGTCHNPNGWTLWRFDHNTQTDFVLDGAHEGRKCEACHRTPVRGDASLPKACNACHQGDDEHRGRFGQQCDRCHTTRSFKDIRLNQ